MYRNHGPFPLKRGSRYEMPVLYDNCCGYPCTACYSCYTYAAGLCVHYRRVIFCGLYRISRAFDNSEQSSVSLKGTESCSFASLSSIIPDFFAFAEKEDRIRFTVSFSQNRSGVIASISDRAVCRYSLIIRTPVRGQYRL